MSYCVLCLQPVSTKAILLRGGACVCAECVAVRNDKLNLIGFKIQDLQGRTPPRNIWDTIATGILLFSIISSILVAIFVHFVVSFAVIIAAMALCTNAKQKSNEINEPFKNSIITEIEKLNEEKSSIKHELQLVYERYLELPPDWLERYNEIIKRDRGVCTKCGRRMHGSTVPFHVHHIVPKSNPSGDHSLGNLQLLCEICHSKIEEQGHQLIRGARKKRLQENRARRTKRKIPRKNMIYHTVRCF